MGWDSAVAGDSAAGGDSTSGGESAADGGLSWPPAPSATTGDAAPTGDVEPAVRSAACVGALSACVGAPCATIARQESSCPLTIARWHGSSMSALQSGQLAAVLRYLIHPWTHDSWNMCLHGRIQSGSAKESGSSEAFNA